jgi:hypothetical protein
MMLTIPLTNLTGNTANGVTLQVFGGGSANYGNIVSGVTASRDVLFTVPRNAPCGSVISLTISVNSSLGPVSFTRTFAVGDPQTSFSEDFEKVTVPAGPAGWTISSSYSPMTWVSTTASADSGAISMFAADLPNCVTGCSITDGGSTELTSPIIHISVAAATVTFRQKYNTEGGWDGGVLEYREFGGDFQDIIAAGGAFVQNGYNGSMGVSPPNPLGGRAGWTGDSGGYVTSVVRLPASAATKNIQLRWRFGADSNGAPAGGGWNVDSVRVAGLYLCFFVGNPTGTNFDYDGDHKADVSVYRPSNGIWYLQQTAAGLTGIQWGISTDKIVPADYDGDEKTDLAVFRPGNGFWYILNSSTQTMTALSFGLAGDIPVPGDFDGDGKADINVYRPSNGIWYRQNSSNGSFYAEQFGTSEDKPQAGDFDGDGKADLAVFRPSNGIWYFHLSSGGFGGVQFGISTDMPVPADYDGDGKTDVAVYRPGNGFWYTLNSSNGAFNAFQFGLPTDLPVPADYDGDGKADIAIWRPSDGNWWRVASSTGAITAFQFGANGDKPTPNAYVY